MELSYKLKVFGTLSLIWLNQLYPVLGSQDYETSIQNGFEVEPINNKLSPAIFDFLPDEEFIDRIPISCNMLMTDQSGTLLTTFNSLCFIDFPSNELNTDLNLNYKYVYSQTDNVPDPYLHTRILLPSSQWQQNAQFLPTTQIEGIELSLIPQTLKRVDEFDSNDCYVGTRFIVDVEYKDNGTLTTGRLLISPWHQQPYECLNEDLFKELYDI